MCVCFVHIFRTYLDKAYGKLSSRANTNKFYFENQLNTIDIVFTLLKITAGIFLGIFCSALPFYQLWWNVDVCVWASIAAIPIRNHWLSEMLVEWWLTIDKLFSPIGEAIETMARVMWIASKANGKHVWKLVSETRACTAHPLFSWQFCFKAILYMCVWL